MVAPSAGPDPWALGAAYEASVPVSVRRVRGAFYTPPAVARGLVEAIGPVESLPAPTFLDPACGAGVFLLAAAEALHRHGVPAAEIIASHVAGCDTDPAAVATTEAALVLWARGHGVDRVPAVAVEVRDGLLDMPAEVGGAAPGAVVGNPPFLGQLRSRTSRGRRDAAALAARFGDAARGYVDDSALFLLAAVETVAPGGAVALIQPESVLSVRDAGPVRRWLVEHATVEALWLGGGGGFDAGVRVCAPILRTNAAPRSGRPVPEDAHQTRPAEPPRSRRAESVQILRDDFGAGGRVEAPDFTRWATWSPLIARNLGVPDLGYDSVGVLGDVASTTADFRDQYYGLVPAVTEAGERGPGGPAGGPADVPAGGPPRLVTTGLVDPARLRWGTAPTRFARRQWRAPVVDAAELDAPMRDWLDRRLVPKVLVASQTRVVEAVADPHAELVPVTPLVTVTPRPDDSTGPDDLGLWHLLALLVGPVATAWALGRFAGAALASDAIKVSARQLLELPLPSDRAAWDRAAGQARRAQQASHPDDHHVALLAAGTTMAAAYGLGPRPASDLVEWWADRLPRRTGVIPA